MSDWDATELFISVVEGGSFTAAAEAQGHSKAHVSRKITQLESHLGTQLLVRTTRKLALTETGRAYYERARDIVGQFHALDRSVIEMREQLQGTLRLTVAGAFGETYVAPFAAELMQQYPDLQIEIDFTNRVVDLVAEGYDIAIRAGALKDSSLVARKIAKRRLVVCGSRTYLDGRGIPVKVSALRQHNCLLGSQPVWRFRDRTGHHSDHRVEGSWSSNNGRALLAAARKDIGLVQLPEFYVHEDIAKGRLIPVLESFEPTDTGEWAVYPRSKHLSPKVRTFIDHLVAKFEAIAYF